MTAPPLRMIPNLLTMARGAMAILFFVCISQYQFPADGEGWLWASIVLFALAALTDYLDGYLARRWKVVSAFGRVMDPFCDKLLVLGALVCLAGPRFVVPSWVAEDAIITTATGLTPWMVVIMLGRELFVTSVRGIAESSGLAFGAKWSGKAKMAFQSLAVPCTLAIVALWHPDEVGWSMWVIRGLMWTTVGITVWSGLPYVAAVPALLRGPERS